MTKTMMQKSEEIRTAGVRLAMSEEQFEALCEQVDREMTVIGMAAKKIGENLSRMNVDDSFEEGDVRKMRAMAMELKAKIDQLNNFIGF